LPFFKNPVNLLQIGDFEIFENNYINKLIFKIN
jgi:hypothetical protein